ncbi:M16 family metallopeptidase [Spiribacter halobius]|uniref:Insulinase family protein n=1 Tax=Sediminicurvatus halobius TaxID=2182432 RepID=A0A2U2N988_9GAMM|nr:insulinase family protein [Spiribacter halobius]PWG65721.1 hypothetical protein DEM34_00145 [Spiribacter halobius]UEX77755.1 insulinase family protein [Spiribacter halobius]
MTAAAAAPPRPAERLANGLPLLRRPGALPWVAAGIWWQAGSRYEPAASPGLAHCLEHLWLAGSAERDRRIDGLGGRVNAETGRELSGLYGVAPAADAAALAELLADAFMEPRLDAAAIAAERPAMLAELAALRANPAERAVQRAIARAWAGHPAARAPEGTPDGIRNLDSAGVGDYRDQRLHAGRLALVLLGDWPNSAVQPLTKALARLPAGQPPSLDPLPVSTLTEPVPAGACHLVWALPAANGGAAAALADLLAGGLGSRLFRRLRETGLGVYDIRAATEVVAGGALCLLCTSAPAGAGAEVAARVEAMLDELAAEGPSEAERALLAARQRAMEGLAGLQPEDWMRRLVLERLADATPARMTRPCIRVAEPL